MFDNRFSGWQNNYYLYFCTCNLFDDLFFLFQDSLFNVTKNNLIRKRSNNWTTAEESILIDLVRKNQNILFGKLSASLSSKMKNERWDKITLTINASSLSNAKRTVKQVKQKWKSIAQESKLRKSNFRKEQRKTG